VNRVGLAVVTVVLGLVAAVDAADDRHWENPVFDTSDEAIAAARGLAPGLDDASPRAERFFVDLTLAGGDLDHRHPSSTLTRRVIGDLLITHPSAFINDDAQRRTVERFLDAVPKQQRVLERRLKRFGYPGLDGLAYLRLVDNVDAFASLNRASSDRMSRVGGVTYYCRYVVLPLSYVSRSNLDELRRSAIHNPTLDVAGTVRQWQNESFASLVNTFRHELVHVHTNSGLGVPRYSDRTAYPTWFHEGTATYLAADPHSGLSASYRVYQDLFFYLVQRYGVGRLQRFYGEVLGGRSVSSVLGETYGLTGSDELFSRSARWHRLKDLVKTGFWVVVLVVVAAAFRGPDAPYIGILQLLAAVALGLAVATGLAEHLYGLNGPAVVVGVKIGLAIATAALATLGIRRIVRHRRAVEA
jgi:hypothetical protein